MNVLKVNNLIKKYGSETVLSGISLEVEKGQVVAVLGASGAGKSTLLRTLTFLEQPDYGTISLSGREIVKADENSLSFTDKAELKAAKGKYGLVFQNFNLFPHYSVMKNITDAPVFVQKRSPQEVYSQAEMLLNKFDLWDKRDAYPSQLSGGQQQRVSIARALALNPDILYFDEPTSALDPQLTGEVLKVIKQLAAENMTMVIVTHEINFARNVADRVVFLSGGLVAEQGSAKEVLDNPKNAKTAAFLKGFFD